MSAHLLLPYSWENCTYPENCKEYIHLQDAADNLNRCPKEWIATFLGNCVIEKESITFYDENQLPHRVDGPAVLWSDSPKEHGEEWYLHGKWHRVDGPALSWSGGGEEWYFEGEWHRDDGPAVTWADGTKEWWIHGKTRPEPQNF